MIKKIVHCSYYSVDIYRIISIYNLIIIIIEFKNWMYSTKEEYIIYVWIIIYYCKFPIYVQINLKIMWNKKNYGIKLNKKRRNIYPFSNLRNNFVFYFSFFCIIRSLKYLFTNFHESLIKFNYIAKIKFVLKNSLSSEI